MKLTKYIMVCVLTFSLAGCIDDEPSHNPITYGAKTRWLLYD